MKSACHPTPPARIYTSPVPRPAPRCPATGGPCLSDCRPGGCWAEAAAARVVQGEGGGGAFHVGGGEGDGFGPLPPNPKETFDRVFAAIPEG